MWSQGAAEQGNPGVFHIPLSAPSLPIYSFKPVKSASMVVDFANHYTLSKFFHAVPYLGIISPSTRSELSPVRLDGNSRGIFKVFKAHVIEQ